MSPCAAVAASATATWSPAIASGAWLVAEDWTSGNPPLPAGTGVDDPDYLHAREYKPWLGRFLSTDPAGDSAKPAAPQSWNRYAYALNNPLKYVDPDGESAKKATELLWTRLKHVVDRHVRKDSHVDRSKFATNDPQRAKKVMEKTVRSPDIVDTQSDGRRVYQKQFSTPQGTEGERMVRVITEPHGANRERVITGHPQSKFVEVLSLLPIIGPLFFAQELAAEGAQAVEDAVLDSLIYEIREEQERMIEEIDRI
jgi:RHS repeat-associated protein